MQCFTPSHQDSCEFESYRCPSCVDFHVTFVGLVLSVVSLVHIVLGKLDGLVTSTTKKNINSHTYIIMRSQEIIRLCTPTASSCISFDTSSTEVRANDSTARACLSPRRLGRSSRRSGSGRWSRSRSPGRPAN